MDLETENKTNEKVEVNKGCSAFWGEIGKFLFWVIIWVILWKCSFSVYSLHFSAMKGEYCLLKLNIALYAFVVVNVHIQVMTELQEVWGIIFNSQFSYFIDSFKDQCKDHVTLCFQRVNRITG